MKNLKVILAVLAVLGLLVMTGCGKKGGSKQDPTQTTAPGETHTVTFYSDDETVLKIDTVPDNASAVPPLHPQITYGRIFKSWDKDLSCVVADMDVHPVCEDTAGKSNVFALSGTYGKPGDTVTVPLTLCGSVCVAGFDITLTYDPEQLELVDVSEDGAVVYNDKTPGQINLNYVSVENTEADVDVCNLKFEIKAQSGELPLKLEVKDVYACKDTVQSNNDELYEAEYTVIDAAVYVLSQEG